VERRGKGWCRWVNIIFKGILCSKCNTETNTHVPLGYATGQMKNFKQPSDKYCKKIYVKLLASNVLSE